MNPAVTLTFWRLGRMNGADALLYVLAQFAGGVLGVLAVHAVFGERFAAPPVIFVANAVNQAARKLVAVSGNNQIGVILENLPRPLIVRTRKMFM